MSDSPYAAVVGSPLGKIGVRISRERLSQVEILSCSSGEHPPTHPVAAAAIDQLFRYFEDPRWHFDVPLELHGTAFQMRVWKALSRIDSGDLTTYGALAKQLDTGPRPVGAACAANPIPIIIPCHRVVASNGLGGYKGRADRETLALKQWLIAHEQR